MRFHQAVAFLETDQLLELCKATDQMGYAGMYVSDHIFFPKDLKSRYTYSPYEDGSPIWSPEADWPDSWCLISAMAAVTTNLHFTTGVYIAPAPRPVHRRQARRHRGGHLEQPGAPRGRRRVVQGGVRRHRPELPRPGEASRRHDPGAARTVDRGVDRVPRDALRRRAAADEPRSHGPDPDLRRRCQRARTPADGALR